jgi:hypothetical protein
MAWVDLPLAGPDVYLEDYTRGGEGSWDRLLFIIGIS